MKAIKLNEKLYDYVLNVGVREQPLLQTIRVELEKHPRAIMLSTPDTIQLLQLLIKVTQAKTILEVGTFVGYSAAAMALVLPDDGKVTTLELREEYAEIAKTYWQQGNIADKIECVVGDALETLAQLPKNSFDLIYIDANKSDYDAYYESSLQLAKQGGLLVFDNMLFHGQVIDETDHSASTTAIRHLNAKLQDDKRVDIAMLTVGDGVTLAVKQ